MTEILKPCPFCGTVGNTGIDDGKYPHIICNMCGGRGPSGYDKASAMERWNERHRKSIDIASRGKSV